MGPVLVTENQRILNKKPRPAVLDGVFYLEAWR
jgi:hypothetical protein